MRRQDSERRGSAFAARGKTKGKLDEALVEEDEDLEEGRKSQDGPQERAWELIYDFHQNPGPSKNTRKLTEFRDKLRVYFRENHKKLDYFLLICEAVHLGKTDILLAIVDGAYGGRGWHLFKAPLHYAPLPIDDAGDVIRGVYDELAGFAAKQEDEDEDDVMPLPGVPDRKGKGKVEDVTQNVHEHHHLEGPNLLHRQAKEGDTTKCFALLKAIRARTDEHGLKQLVNVRAGGNAGATAFDLACWHGFPEIVRFFMSDVGPILEITRIAMHGAIIEGGNKDADTGVQLDRLTEEQLEIRLKKRKDFQAVVKMLLDWATRNEEHQERYVDVPLYYRVNVYDMIKALNREALLKMFRPDGEYDREHG